MGSICTTINNFQDAFRQKNEPYGALLTCCAMKGYIVSQKKYSYFDPMNLDWNGPFHCNWPKISIAVMGKFQSVISKSLYKSAAFQKGTTETSIMKGGKDGMSVIAEAMTRLKFEAFE